MDDARPDDVVEWNIHRMLSVRDVNLFVVFSARGNDKKAGAASDTSSSVSPRNRTLIHNNSEAAQALSDNVSEWAHLSF
jgi:hypothetical protein